jgi:DNA-binding transcriptional MerR regulator
MQETKTLTTGQVSGLLGIPVVSLQRYVREFGQHFSKTAGQHRRGRRWAPVDIDNLMIIRRMHQAQAGIESIDQALQNYHHGDDHIAETGDAAGTSKVMDAFSLLATAAAVLDEVREERARVQALALQARWNDSQFKDLEGRFTRTFAYIHGKLEELDRRYYKLGAVYKNALRKYPAAKPYRQLLSEFDTWIKRNILDDLGLD